MKTWIVLGDTEIKETDSKSSRTKDIINTLLKNRGLLDTKEIEEYLYPKLSSLTVENVEIDKEQLDKSIKRIKVAIKKKEQIIVFGDYDVDGICGSAILWETLNSLGANVMPYIPNRIDEGYGVSIVGTENVLVKYPDTKVIITVDNGIVANEAVDFANTKNLDIIITDHHVPSSKKPSAFSIVHTTKLCGAAVAYMLSQELLREYKATSSSHEHLSLAAIATIADLVPLKEANRIIAKFGIDEIRRTKRPGLLALIKESGLEKETVNVFEIGHMLGPRLNAMGRLEMAMDSLRLICTKNEKSCRELAEKLGITNKKRQDITLTAFEDAKAKVRKKIPDSLIFIADKSYQPGVIGLIAGRLVEEFYRPSIVLSVGEKFSKASARSVSGFNIIEFIRTTSDLLVDAGGHPMAAGFTVETANIKKLSKKVLQLAKEKVEPKLLERQIKIDTEIFFEDIGEDFYNEVQKLAPFGNGNHTPVFITKNLLVSDLKKVGKENQHVSFRLVSPENKPLNAIGFNFLDRIVDVRIGDRVDIAYTLDREVWKGIAKFKIKLKDLRLSDFKT